MRKVVQVLMGVASLSFVVGIVLAFTGGKIMGIPPRSFARATEDLMLIAIGLLLWSQGQPPKS